MERVATLQVQATVAVAAEKKGRCPRRRPSARGEAVRTAHGAPIRVAPPRHSARRYVREYVMATAMGERAREAGRGRPQPGWGSVRVGGAQGSERAISADARGHAGIEWGRELCARWAGARRLHVSPPGVAGGPGATPALWFPSVTPDGVKKFVTATVESSSSCSRAELAHKSTVW